MRFLACLAALLLSGCAFVDVRGSGNLQTRDMPLGEFDSIVAGGSFSVDVTQGSATSVVVTADDNLWDYITVRNDSGTLRLEMKPYSYSNTHLSAKIVTPRLKGLELSGATVGTMRGFDYSQGKFNLEISGASTLTDGDLRAGQADVNVSGASTATMRGRVDDLNLEVSGASHASLADFATKTAHVEVSGASGADVRVTEQLSYDVSGASHLSIAGNPRVQKGDSSGASDVSSR
jgi:hypothetical protein